MPALLDENHTCIVQGNGGGRLCPHASTKITHVQYKEMGGGAMPTRVDEKNTCTRYSTRKWGGGGAMPKRLNENSTCKVQIYTNPVGARVEHDIDL